MILITHFVFFFSMILAGLASATSLDAGISPQPMLSAQKALSNMVTAMQTLNFQGTVVFMRNGKLEPMKYFHAINEGREQERLLSLNSPLREIVRDAKQVRCLYKSTQTLNVDYRPFERSFLIDIPDDLQALNAVYEILLTGQEDIALRPSYVIALKPKDNLRYPRTVWLDTQHFLPLKIATYDFTNTIIEQKVFTDLQIVVEIALVETQQPKAMSPQLSTIEREFIIASLPKGFKEIYFTRRPLHNSQPVDHLLLSDGLAFVSVYWEKNAKNHPAPPQTDKHVQSLDTVNFFSRTLDTNELTVMGEVPAETVKAIAEAVELKKIGD